MASHSQPIIDICDWPGTSLTGNLYVWKGETFKFRANNPYCTETTHTWYVNNQMASNEEYYPYTFNTVGVTNIKKQEEGCTGQDEPMSNWCFATVHVSESKGSISGDPGVCEGGSTTLTFNSTGLMAPECWEIIGAGKSGCEDDSGNSTFTFKSEGLSTGRYEVRVYDPDDYDPDVRTSYVSKYVTVHATPSLPGLECVNIEVIDCVKKLTLNPSCSYGTTHSWDLSGSNTHYMTSTKTFKIYKTNNVTECTSSASFTLGPHVNDLPIPSFSNVSTETNNQCQKVLILSDNYEEYNLSWNLSGSKPAITEAQGKEVTLFLTESSTGCSKQNVKKYYPYGMDPGEIVQFDQLICESKFKVEELNLHRAELDNCKVESMNWDIPNSEEVPRLF